MSLMSETLKSDVTWNFLTDLPAGVMTMFFLTRYMSMSGLISLWCLRILLDSSLLILESRLRLTRVSRQRTTMNIARMLQPML